MSYFPDYRKETDKLNEVDKAFIAGYRAAMEDAWCFFNNSHIYENVDHEAVSQAIESFEHWANMQEIEAVCSLFDNADYLPDDIDLVDANKPLYENTKGAKAR